MGIMSFKRNRLYMTWESHALRFKVLPLRCLFSWPRLPRDAEKRAENRTMSNCPSRHSNAKGCTRRETVTLYGLRCCLWEVCSLGLFCHVSEKRPMSKWISHHSNAKGCTWRERVTLYGLRCCLWDSLVCCGTVQRVDMCCSVCCSDWCSLSTW